MLIKNKRRRPDMFNPLQTSETADCQHSLRLTCLAGHGAQRTATAFPLNRKTYSCPPYTFE